MKLLTPMEALAFNALVDGFDLATRWQFDDVSNVRALVEISRARGLHVLAGALENFVE